MQINKIRHSLAHIMACAVQELYPKVKFGIGPEIENGFYYDFDFPSPVSENEIQKIEKRPKKFDLGSDFTKKELMTGMISTLEKIEYYNTNNDSYLNKWVYFVNDRATKSLEYNEPFLKLIDKNSIAIKNITINQSLFETIPPRNHEEWKRLGALLKKHEKNISADDFETMFNQFDAPTITVNSSENVKELDEGTRFTCNDCTVNNVSIEDGDYLIEYDSFSVKKYTRPFLTNELHPMKQIHNFDIPEELEFRIIVFNNGELTETTISDDALNTKIVLYDAGNVITTRVIPVIKAGNNASIDFNYLPLKGDHNLMVEISSQNSAVENSSISMGSFIVHNDLNLEHSRKTYDDTILKLLYLILIGALSIPIMHILYHYTEK